MPKERVFYHHPDAAEYKTVTLTGWWSSNGHFYGDDEHMARWAGCTHQKCECGRYMSKSWTKCDTCRDKADHERWLVLPHVDWNGNEPVYCEVLEEYFFSDSSLLDDLEYRDTKAEDLRLTICEPITPRLIECDNWVDEIPEDQELGEVCPELAVLVGAVNNYIIKYKPIFSWRPGKQRTSINPREYQTEGVA
ncbi:hypothetical protein [Pseudovibrio sp. Tun.PSC04-5.I4]|uniref:hypothetical protein n=1 Tax=Pseudovibrio sp. Tun.PSC04-5.I4 TaxID=1798213 RepID=UPI0008815F25|nr:hypothetical protein [Pseudovibrio sp. Tun.PSC04-5.I4]SDQ98923.1 hypothetical protein SAMN04515695_2198 [Pseudovibrio sp. Tun.PSC04-5.I4]